jgi:cyclic pyranopterin phosphate synthase
MNPGEANMSTIHKISLSTVKGEKKENVGRATLIEGGGIVGDIHGNTDRPLSLLPFESFSKLAHPDLSIAPGDFGENITTTGLDFSTLTIGSRLRLGSRAIIEVIQFGKECHDGCKIRETAGDCIMPREGVFARVIRGGDIKPDDEIVHMETS